MTEPRGSIYLIERAPLDLTYQHTIDFTSPDEQLSYWGSKVKYRLADYSYIRRERRYIRINKRFEDLESVNYLYFQSRENSKYYFCFVTDREYVNDETTNVFFEVDVLQSFMFDYTFKPSYILQGHVDRWTADHNPIYSRTDEGLNYGSEYVTEAAYRLKPRAPHKHGFYLVYVKGLKPDNAELPSGNTSLGVTVSYNSPIPYRLLIFPAVMNKDLNANTLRSSSIQELFTFMSETSFGNFVDQIVYMQYLPIKYSARYSTSAEKESEGIDFVFGFNAPRVVSNSITTKDGTRTLHFHEIARIAPDDLRTTYGELDLFAGLEEKLPPAKLWESVKANPYKSERDRRFESKLLCFPYRYNIFTDWVNVPALIKNEYIGSDKITIKGSVGFGFNSPRRFWVDSYRKDPEGREASIGQLLPLEQPVVNDQYYTYLLNNRNQISANLANAKTNAALAVVTGAVSGATSGAASGAAFGPWGAVIGAAAGTVVGGASAAVQHGTNIHNMIRSENARQADLKNLPDTIATSNDCSLALTDENTYITIYRKAICCEFEEQLAQFWHMYGYKINRLDVPNLRSRLRYNFIKTVGANIEGKIESQYLAAIKAIYDNGVTIWHYSKNDFYPLDYTYENIERSLL